MKALTICQPYAHLICLPDDDDRAKRVENRSWYNGFTGTLLIHAGKSRDWLELDETETRDEDYDLPLADMVFGAIVGVCRVAGAFAMEKTTLKYPPHNGREALVIPDGALRRWSWLACHEHVEGPQCWVLRECRKFNEPIPYRGAQGLFNVPDELVAEALREVEYAK